MFKNGQEGTRVQARVLRAAHGGLFLSPISRRVEGRGFLGVSKPAGAAPQSCGRASPTLGTRPDHPEGHRGGSEVVSFHVSSRVSLQNKTQNPSRVHGGNMSFPPLLWNRESRLVGRAAEKQGLNCFPLVSSGPEPALRPGPVAQGGQPGEGVWAEAARARRGPRGGAKPRQLAGRREAGGPAGAGSSPARPGEPGPHRGRRHPAASGAGRPSCGRRRGEGRPRLTSGRGAPLPEGPAPAQPAAGVAPKAPRAALPPPSPRAAAERPRRPRVWPVAREQRVGRGRGAGGPDSRLGDSRKEGGRAAVGVGRGGNILSAPGAPQTASRASRPDGARGQERGGAPGGGGGGCARARDGAGSPEEPP